MRTTDNKKDNVLRIRISEDMYKYLTNRIERDSSNISEYIRELIQRDMISKKNS